MRKTFYITILYVLSGLSVMGQVTTPDTVDLLALSLEELAQVTITSASKFEQQIKDAPSPVSVVTRKQIIRYGWLSGNEVMYRLPGFSVSQDYERQTISSRGNYEGWNHNHILMLIDGVPVNDNLHSTAVTWEATPLTFVRSLEVVRGPGSALYGSSATNGIIEYKTIDAKDLDGKAEIRFRAGGMGTYIADVLLGHETESLSLVSAFNYYETEGDTYESYDGSELRKFPITSPRSSFYLFNKISGQGKLAGFSLQHHEQSWQYSTGHGWLFFVPDRGEHLQDSRRMLMLRYKTPNRFKPLQHEYLVRYQRFSTDLDVRLFPNDTFFFPWGLSERLHTHATDLFTRAQWSYTLKDKSILLGGTESTVFLYNGDDVHTANAQLGTDYSPTPDNEMIEVGDFMAWIRSNPVFNTGVFVQYTSAKLWNRLEATLGLRYDHTFFRLNAIDVNSNREDPMDFNKLSPRFSLVYTASPRLTLKAIGGRAFRAPVPTELFASNTVLGASNPRQLRPEVITTYEFAADLNINRFLTWRLNLFNTQFDDQIAFSVSNFNLSTNLYKQRNVGIENEFLFEKGPWEAFLNHSYAQRWDEEIIDPTIAPSKDKLTWIPNHTGNAGITYNHVKYYFTLQSHHQGRVRRRSSDQSEKANAFRGEDVKSWTTVDAKVAYKPWEGVEIGITGTNLFNEKGKLLKNNLYIFDYQIPGRRILVDLRLLF